MGEVISDMPPRVRSPFNGPVELGLRALCVLTAAFPRAYSLQQLVVFDYLVVHSDDLPQGPTGLHPQTPLRGGEILVRRGVIQEGLSLYESRRLIQRVYGGEGIVFLAAEASAGFLDAFRSRYVGDLRTRADWLVDTLGDLDEVELGKIVDDRIGTWGAEFTTASEEGL